MATVKSNTKIVQSVIVNAGMCELQLYLYKSIIKRDLDILNNQTKVNKQTLLNTVMQLKDCCNHPYLFKGIENEQSVKGKALKGLPLSENYTTHHLIKNCGKLFILDKLIQKLSNKNKKILLCSTITKMATILEEYCNVRGLSYHRITKENTSEINDKCITIHCTFNKDIFIQMAKTNSFSNIDTIIFYDTDWNQQSKEKQIINSLNNINMIYKMNTIDSLEEKIFKMKQKTKLNVNELTSLIKYKANKILNINDKSTLNMDVNIDDVLNAKMDDNSDNVNDGDNIVEEPVKYTLRDILNHPDNQPVIRMFAVFFIAMILIPIVCVIMLNKYVMNDVLLDWTKEGKENLTIVIGVAIAHFIGIIYVCYSWSGEDRIPARILDAEPEDDDSEQESDESDDIKDENVETANLSDSDNTQSNSGSDDAKEYEFVDHGDIDKTKDTKDIIQSKDIVNSVNTVRKRRRRGKRNRGKGGKK